MILQHKRALNMSIAVTVLRNTGFKACVTSLTNMALKPSIQTRVSLLFGENPWDFTHKASISYIWIKEHQNCTWSVIRALIEYIYKYTHKYIYIYYVHIYIYTYNYNTNQMHTNGVVYIFTYIYYCYFIFCIRSLNSIIVSSFNLYPFYCLPHVGGYIYIYMYIYIYTHTILVVCIVLVFLLYYNSLTVFL